MMRLPAVARAFTVATISSSRLRASSVPPSAVSHSDRWVSTNCLNALKVPNSVSLKVCLGMIRPLSRPIRSAALVWIAKSVVPMPTYG